MLKKILIVCLPVLVFSAFLVVFILSSNPKKPKGSEENPSHSDIFEIFATKQGEGQGEPALPAPESGREGELVYEAPYTLEHIKDIFEKDKDLFEQIKNIEMPEGYSYFIALRTYDSESGCKIDFYEFNGGEQKSVSQTIAEDGEYGGIYEFFQKYEDIGQIHAIDPKDPKYTDENLVIMFELSISVSVYSQYTPWAQIRYNKAGGEIEEKATGEYLIVPLDDHWYYIYSNMY